MCVCLCWNVKDIQMRKKPTTKCTNTACIYRTQVANKRNLHLDRASNELQKAVYNLHSLLHSFPEWRKLWFCFGHFFSLEFVPATLFLFNFISIFNVNSMFVYYAAPYCMHKISSSYTIFHSYLQRRLPIPYGFVSLNCVCVCVSRVLNSFWIYRLDVSTNAITKNQTNFDFFLSFIRLVHCLCSLYCHCLVIVLLLFRSIFCSSLFFWLVIECVELIVCNVHLCIHCHLYQ